MNINDLLDELEKELEESSKMLFTGKKLVDKDYIMDILKDIRENLPMELSQARAIVNDKQRIIGEADCEAASKMEAVDAKIKTLVDENAITERAYERADQIIETAQHNAADIRLGAQTYADEILEDMERYVGEYLDILRGNREELRKK